MDYITKVCELLKQKQVNNELFTMTELNFIVKWIVKGEKVQDYVKKIAFDDSVGSYASYSRENLTIIINTKKCVDNNNNFINNVYLLHAILHEINHAKQYKLIETNEGVDALEKDRLTLELLLKHQEISKIQGLLFDDKDNITFKEIFKQIRKAKKIKRFYKGSKGYVSHFSERQAEYDAIEKCQLILEQINNEESLALSDIYRRKKYKIILIGYKKILFYVKYPYKYFQKNSDIYDPNGNINLTFDNVKDLDERLMHGFPITKKEFEEIDLLAHTQDYPNVKINQISKRKK